MSQDGENAVVVIAMLGNPFSPFYAAKRGQGPASPLDFCAMNVALYERRGTRWALTERRGATRTPELLGIGPSSISRTPNGYSIAIDEIVALGRRRIVGSIDVELEATFGEPQSLDAGGEHLWWPIAPVCSVEVNLRDPKLHFSGQGYMDANAGAGPLEDAFDEWHWSRTSGRGHTRISYAVRRRDGSQKVIDLASDATGTRALESCEDVGLPPTAWSVPRTYRGPAGHRVRVARALEDTPFYARSQLELTGASEKLTAVHETLSLDRFRSPLVRMLLPARMRRVTA